MTSRERVLKALRHEEPDRTPIFERIIAPPTVNEILGSRSIITDPPYRMEILSEASWEEIVEREAKEIFKIATDLGFDMVCLGTNIEKDFERPVKIGENTWRQGDLIVRCLESSGTMERRPVDEKTGPELIEERRRVILDDYTPPEIRDDQLYVFRRVRELMAENGIELAIYVSNYSLNVCGLPNFMFEWYYTEPELIERFYTKSSTWAIDRGKVMVREGADLIGIGGDSAGNLGPVISPEHYRRFIVPSIRAQARGLKSEGAFVNNNSDGNLWPIIEDFLISTEVQGYGEIDKDSGMDLGLLKERYGDRIFFLGNLDIRRTLCKGTVEDARREMIECIEKGWGSGGHVIMTSNIVHRDVKPENYCAAIEAYREYFGLN